MSDFIRKILDIPWVLRLTEPETKAVFADSARQEFRGGIFPGIPLATELWETVITSATLEGLLSKLRRLRWVKSDKMATGHPERGAWEIIIFGDPESPTWAPRSRWSGLVSDLMETFRSRGTASQELR
eukprot:Gregarina_sp_Poly_1__11150@NODE_905_length_5764_cov_9_157627_g645_i0_p5_GENE_NODE_905_length_5764_cov_9_157627_g645_i0NODE_905_length_5764_cov_9_157627_g645_i0_p5_ORF_typecomplete_len128_score20_36_NODE_905_length_5764_cov_9_157627_g645_i020212404